MKIKLAIIGCGNMGSAIAQGVAQKNEQFEFYCFDLNADKRSELATNCKGVAVESLAEFSKCEYFLLAVKPQQFAELAATLKPHLPSGAKIISVLAGTSSATLQDELGIKQLVRVMPNTPCLIGEGISGLYFVGMNENDKTTVKSIFSAVGTVIEVDSDDMIDKITALSGSGPAYIFEITRIIAAKAQAFGFAEKTAQQIAVQLVKGAGSLMAGQDITPEELRIQVTSEKGTTEAALNILNELKLESVFCEAIQAAYERAKVLSS